MQPVPMFLPHSDIMANPSTKHDQIRQIHQDVNVTSKKEILAAPIDTFYQIWISN